MCAIHTIGALDPHVEAVADYVAGLDKRQRVSVAIESEDRVGKSYFLSRLASALPQRSVLVLDLNVARVQSSEPLLAHLIISTREQLNRQLWWRRSPVRLFSLAWKLMRVRRQRLALLRTSLSVLIYAVLFWYAAVLVVHVGPHHIVDLVSTQQAPPDPTHKPSVVAFEIRPEIVLAILKTFATPAVVVVLALVLLRRIEKLMPFPSANRVAAAFGKETLRQHLSFDSSQLEEFSVTLQSLAPDRRICILVDGLDQSEPVRLIEMLSVIRWLSLRCTEPIAAIACLDPLYAAGALLTSDSPLVEQIAKLDQSQSSKDQPPQHGFTFDSHGIGVVPEILPLIVAQHSLERFFDLSIALPRLSSGAIEAALFDGAPLKVGATMAGPPDCSTSQRKIVARMAALALEGNIGRASRFLEEFDVVWRALKYSARSDINPRYDQLTPEQAAKALLSLRCWPAMRFDLYQRPSLLEELESIFIGEHPVADLSTDPMLHGWTSTKRLQDLLRFGLIEIEPESTQEEIRSSPGDSDPKTDQYESHACENDLMNNDRSRLEFLNRRAKFSLSGVPLEILLYAGV
jgi:hypothetical protein